MLSHSFTDKERWLYKIQQQKASCVVATLLKHYHIRLLYFIWLSYWDAAIERTIMIVITSGIARITNMPTMGCRNLLTYKWQIVWTQWVVFVMLYTDEGALFCPYFSYWQMKWDWLLLTVLGNICPEMMFVGNIQSCPLVSRSIHTRDSYFCYVWVFPKCFHWFYWIEWQKLLYFKKIIGACHLLCKRSRRYHSTNKTQVVESIFELSSIHVPVIYQIHWIRWSHWILIHLGKTSIELHSSYTLEKRES